MFARASAAGASPQPMPCFFYLTLVVFLCFFFLNSCIVNIYALQFSRTLLKKIDLPLLFLIMYRCIYVHVDIVHLTTGTLRGHLRASDALALELDGCEPSDMDARS